MHRRFIWRFVTVTTLQRVKLRTGFSKLLRSAPGPNRSLAWTGHEKRGDPTERVQVEDGSFGVGGRFGFDGRLSREENAETVARFLGIPNHLVFLPPFRIEQNPQDFRRRRQTLLQREFRLVDPTLHPLVETPSFLFLLRLHLVISQSDHVPPSTPETPPASTPSPNCLRSSRS